MLRLLAIVSLVGCSFDGVDPGGSDSGNTPDARADGAARADAATPDATVPLGPWSVPLPLAGVDIIGALADYDDPFVVAQTNRIYFAAGGSLGTQEIYVGDFVPIGPAVTNVTRISDFPMIAGENVPWVDATETTMLFGALNVATYDIFESSRADAQSAWETPSLAPFVNLNTAGNEVPSNVRGTEIIFPTDNASADLMTATRAGTGVFGTPTALPNHSDPNIDEFGGKISADGLTMAYHARPVGTPNDAIDIFVSERTRVDVPFPVGAPATELNSDVNDQDLWISPNGQLALFASNRSGRFRIYYSTRSKR